MIERRSARTFSRFFAIVGIIIFCLGTVRLSSVTVLGDALHHFGDPYFRAMFEHHLWMFVIGFIAIGYVSRGHLWSFGINSKNLKTSMQWVGILYGVVMLGTLILKYFNRIALPIPEDKIPVTLSGIIPAMLVYWMSSPVANQIVFLGFGQTMLLKEIKYDVKIGIIPVPVIVTALLFTVGATDSAYSTPVLSVLSTFSVGLFCSLAYWKTGSLIAPMLGHAFVFGFPLFLNSIPRHW